MNTAERSKARWAEVLARAGAAGRAWRKSLVTRLADRISAHDALAADPEALKRAIKAQRRARAQDHWSFKPERLRGLLALYLRAREERRRLRGDRPTAPGPLGTRRPH